ncbi:hypothetical protein [Peptoanaerobacter stomatis]
MAIVIFIILYINKFFVPDRAFDTLNYHLYNQENFGVSLYKYNFFPQRVINSHSFVLGDTSHYIFRSILGYRLGTILNTIVMIIIYFQLKKILFKYLVDMNINTPKKYKSLEFFLMIWIILNEIFLWNIASYYVDILAVPLVLELIYILFFILTDNKNEYIYYISFLSGLIIALKISNAILILFFAVYYIFKNRNILKNYKMYLGVILLLLILTPYIIDSYKQTGNPIFPFANKIFKSSFFYTDITVMDFIGFRNRFGPKKFFEYIFWPIYMIIHPEKSGDVVFYSGRVLIYTISIIYMCVHSIKNNTFYKCSKLIIFYLSIYIIYLFYFFGYNRYFPIIDILGGMVVFISIFYSLNDNLKYRKNYYVLFLCLLITLQTIYLSFGYFIRNIEFSWRESLLSNLKTYILNYKYILNDKVSYNLTKDYNIDTWLIVENDSGLATILNNDIPMININETFLNDFLKEKIKKIKANLKDKNTFIISEQEFIDSKFEILKNLNVTINNIYVIKPNFIDINRNLILMKVKVDCKDNISNLYNYKDFNIFEVSLNKNKNKIEMVLGIDPITYNWNSDGVYMKVIGVNSNSGDKKIIFDDELKISEFKNIRLENYDKIIFEKYNKNDKNANGDWVKIIINEQ